MTRLERAFRRHWRRVYRHPERDLELAVAVADYAVKRGWRHPMSSRFAYPKVPPPVYKRGQCP